MMQATDRKKPEIPAETALTPLAPEPPRAAHADLRATPETAKVADLMIDPVNAAYRYWLARKMLPLAMKTPVTPNQITVTHILVGLVASGFVFQGSRTSFVIAVFLYELRMVLDCLDGVVARAKKMTSMYGRQLDAVGDAVTYVTLSAALSFRLFVASHNYRDLALFFVLIPIGAVSAAAHEFYMARFGAALKNKKDQIFEELVAEERVRRERGSTIVTWVGWVKDWWSVSVLAAPDRAAIRKAVRDTLEGKPAVSPTAGQVDHILMHANDAKLHRALRAVGLTSGDNILFVLHLGLLTGMLRGFALGAIGFGFVSFAGCIFVCNRFLAGMRKEAELDLDESGPRVRSPEKIGRS